MLIKSLELKRSTNYLIAVYIALISLLVFRIVVHPNNYTTPDSHAYIHTAKTIKNSWFGGDNTPPPTATNTTSFNTANWPIGYPASIALVSYFTNTSELLSSKVVNFIFIGFIFILLHYWIRQRAWFVTLSFFSYGSLEVFSHTWSEAPFLFFVLLSSFLIARHFQSVTPSHFFFLQLSACLVALFLFRYVGLVYFILTAIILILYLFQKKYHKARQIFLALIFASLFVAWYLFQNKSLNGSFFGEARVFPHQGSIVEFFKLLGIGLINEVSIARNYFFHGSLDILYIISTGIQLSLIVLLYKHRKLITVPFTTRPEVKALLAMGIFYLVVLIVLRWLQPFDNFDYRLLAPFTIPILLAIFIGISENQQSQYFEKCGKWVVMFMIFSCVINLPKTYLLNLLN